jgi:hypothetical protein
LGLLINIYDAINRHLSPHTTGLKIGKELQVRSKRSPTVVKLEEIEVGALALCGYIDCVMEGIYMVEF